MSLHYLVKLEMLIVDLLPLSCYSKKLQNLFHLNCGLQIRQIWIHLRDIIRVRWETFTSFWNKFIPETAY